APAQGFAAGGDRRSLRLHADDEALIRAAAARSPRVVVAVMAGSAVLMPWLDDVQAALLLWYPGMEGGHALADVLTGASEPGGRLPFAIPQGEDDLVPFEIDADRTTYGLLHGQWWLDWNGVEAQRPLGFGLGYTRFTLEDPKRDADRVSVTVRNVGARGGSTVVQLYGAVPGSAFERPPKRLVGFARVALGPGESRRIAIQADRALLDVRRDGVWLREPLPVELAIGLDAASASPVPAR
ncbi:MAG: glycoside hydrolase family 3 C-terminal domain-containing protein, partial [Myxococcota bacterium]